MLRLSLLALLSQLVSGAVYYVAPQGKDSGAGSRSAPFRTIMRGTQAAIAGDTIIVRDGKYGHDGTITRGDGSQINQSPVILRKSGRPDAWITLRAENKWGATLDCEMRCDSYIDLHNAAYIIIQGFVITRGFKEGIHSNDAAHHITIRGNRIEYIANRSSSTGLGLSGLYTNPNCHDFIVDGNVFHDIGRMNSSQLDHALYLRGTNFVVTNNIFYNIRRGWSIQTAEGLNGTLIAHNVFAFENTPGKSGQIMLWGRQTNLVIRNNIFFEPNQFAITRYQASITACNIDHNIVYKASSVMLDSSGCSVHDNRISTNPLFVDAAQEPYDFRLQSSSPAIGCGAPSDVRIDFDGRGRNVEGPTDCGAFSYSAVSH